MKRQVFLGLFFMIISVSLLGICENTGVYAASTEDAQEKNEILASKSRYLTNKGSYMEVRLEVKDGDNVTTQLQAAFILAKTKATDEIPYKIILPEGEYHLSSTLHIYSNTELLLEDAVLIRDFQEGPMLMSGNREQESYNAEREKNIIIRGGTFNGNCYDKWYGAITTAFDNLSFSHVENITLENVTVKNNMGGHYVEINGSDNIRIENCKFCYYEENNAVDNYYGKEAVHFGTVREQNEDGSEKEISCSNILVQGNQFIDVYSGIGFQYAQSGIAYDNVVIYKNSFLNCKETAIYLSSLSKSKICQNQINYAKSGILIKIEQTKRGGRIFDCQIKDNYIENARKLEFMNLTSFGMF